MNKLFYNAAATDSAGDPTGVVLKAIGDMKAGMLTKAESEAIATKAAGDAVAPLAADITALKTQVNAIDEKAGKLTVPTVKGGLLHDIKEGIKANLKGDTLGKFSFGDATSTDRLLKTAGVMTTTDDLLAGAGVSTYDLRLNSLQGRAVNFRNLVSVIPSSTGIFQFPLKVV